MERYHLGFEPNLVPYPLVITMNPHTEFLRDTTIFWQKEDLAFHLIPGRHPVTTKSNPGVLFTFPVFRKQGPVSPGRYSKNQTSSFPIVWVPYLPSSLSQPNQTWYTNPLHRLVATVTVPVPPPHRLRRIHHHPPGKMPPLKDLSIESLKKLSKKSS